MKIQEMLIFIFGKQRKVRFIRMLIILCIVLLAVMLIQNISCGVRDNLFWFEWQPAADIKIIK